MKNVFYSTGEVMKLAHITKKTVRYYDEHNILKPSFVTDSGARYYGETELAKLQQILLFKYLGFSLEDIKELLVSEEKPAALTETLSLQKRLVEDRARQLQIVSSMLSETMVQLQQKESVDWSHMLSLIHDMELEKSLKNQYLNTTNITARISLHEKCSKNPKGWFPWLFEQCGLKSGMKVLELGCGDGSFWTDSFSVIPKKIKITLSDISEGVLRDAKRAIGSEDKRFSYECFDFCCIPKETEQYDLVIANHALFYSEDIKKTCEEVNRVLKTGGVFACSTYGKHHMKEINHLVADFDDRIVLAKTDLYELFGKENGKDILNPFFSEIDWREYEDSLFITEPELLISYILSCHGNQNQYILSKYNEFRSFVRERLQNGFSVTKEAGMFFCRK